MTIRSAPFCCPAGRRGLHRARPGSWHQLHRRGGPPPATTPAKPPPARPATLVTERVRQGVLDTDRALLAKTRARSQKKSGRQADRRVLGGPADRSAPASDLLPSWKRALTGRALRLLPGQLLRLPPGRSHRQRRDFAQRPGGARIRQARPRSWNRPPDRIVADVPEVEFNAAPGGKLDNDQAKRSTGVRPQSRYTLIRDAGGTCASANRVPSYPEGGAGRSSGAGRGPANFRSAAAPGRTPARCRAG